MFVIIKQISTNEICFIGNIKKQMHSHYLIEPLHLNEKITTYNDFIRFYTFQQLYIRNFIETNEFSIANEIPFYENDLLVKHQIKKLDQSLISDTRNVVVIDIVDCTMNFCSFMCVLMNLCQEIHDFCARTNLSQSIPSIIWNQIYCSSFDQNISTLSDVLFSVLYNQKTFLEKCKNFLANLKKKMISDYKHHRGSSRLISKHCYLNDIVSHMKCKCILYMGDTFNSESLISIFHHTGNVCVIKDINRINTNQISVTYENIDI